MVQKRSWEMSFLFHSLLQHQPFEDPVSVPSNGSALSQDCRFKSLFWRQRIACPGGKRQFGFPCASLSGLLTDLPGQAAEDALPRPGSRGFCDGATGETRYGQSSAGLGGCPLPSLRRMRNQSSPCFFPSCCLCTVPQSQRR